MLVQMSAEKSCRYLTECKQHVFGRFFAVPGRSWTRSKRHTVYYDVLRVLRSHKGQSKELRSRAKDTRKGQAKDAFRRVFLGAALAADWLPKDDKPNWTLHFWVCEADMQVHMEYILR
jgi:hypothetical protein